MATLEAYLRERLSQEGVVLDDGFGARYRFNEYEPRHESRNFCFTPLLDGLTVQLSYEDIKNWIVVEEPSTAPTQARK